MEKTGVQKLARALRVAVIVMFVCVILVLLLTPTYAYLRILDGAEIGFLDIWDELIALWEHDPGDALIWLLPAWVTILLAPLFAGSVWTLVPGFVLLISGVCVDVILWQGKRVLDTIIAGEPFSMKNAANLKRAAVCCWIISGVALVRLILGFAYYRNVRPLFTYNGLFVPVFLIGGLLCMVMSALFRQAAEMKAENDLTI